MKLKSTYFLAIFLFVMSCAPQATATPEATVTLPPTKTPIPTPTLNPQFAVLQEKIASNGNRFTLNSADGLIYDGSESVPGLHVAPDGTMTLTVNGETVTIDLADVNFDDENGINIDGYELTEDGWVEAVSEAMQTAEQHFADLGYPTDGVEFVEGEVTVTGRVDGVKVFEMNIKSGEVMFDQNYVEAQASQMKLDPSELGPREDILKATGQYFIDQSSWTPIFEEYVEPMRGAYADKFGVELPWDDPTVSFVMLDPEINAWGTILEMNYKDPKAPRYLYYRDEAGKGYIVPLMPEK